MPHRARMVEMPIGSYALRRTARHHRVVPQTGKIVIEWERRHEDPLRYNWTMRCEPPLSLEETTAICEQIATDHRDLLDGQQRNP